MTEVFANVNPEILLLAEEKGEAIAAALQALSPDEKAVISAVFVSGYTINDIAKRTGKHRNTIRRYRDNAITHLKELLKDWY